MTDMARLLSTSDLDDDDIATLRQMITQYRADPIATYVDHTPTSQLLNEAAHMLRNLMIGRGVDRLNGFRWEDFVRELFDRAAAFKTIEDEGK